jgi:DNA-binding CsgD family transcriptional regulator
MAGSHGPRALSRIEQLCSAGLDERTLRIRLLDVLASAIPHSSYVFLLTDPVTCVGASPIATIQGLGLERLPALILSKYLTQVNRWTSLQQVETLDAATQGCPERSLVWDQVQRALGVSDVLSAAFRDRHGCWGFLDLWRTDELLFDHEEVQLLSAASPMITRAIRQSLAGTFQETATGDRLGPVVLLLGPDLWVRSQTASSEPWLRLLNPPDGSASPVPAQAYNVAAQLVAQEQGVDDHEPRSRVHLTAGRWVTLRAGRLDNDITVAIEDCSAAERIEIFGLTQGLTARETEVLGLLCAGMDNRAIAQRLVISEHTAHDHVRAILAHSDAHSRQLLISRVLGST